jgi:hypothetical protein
MASKVTRHCPKTVRELDVSPNELYEIQINAYTTVELGTTKQGNVYILFSNTFYDKYFDEYFAPCKAREMAAALLAYANHVERG